MAYRAVVPAIHTNSNVPFFDRDTGRGAEAPEAAEDVAGVVSALL